MRRALLLLIFLSAFLPCVQGWWWSETAAEDACDAVRRVFLSAFRLPDHEGGSGGVCRQGKQKAGGGMDGGSDAAVEWLAEQRASLGDKSVVFSRETLRQFDGRVPGRPLLLCVLGECFDVSAGEQFYGPDQSYNCFAGNDGTRAFVSGKFTAEGCHDDVSDFSGVQMMGVEHWLNFYSNHSDYTRVGVLQGMYYDETGKATELRAAALQKAVQQRLDELSLKVLPGCNSRFEAATERAAATSQVWCSSDSGGIERHWVGFPRLETPKEQGKAARCVCVPAERVKEEGLSEYPNCGPEDDRCIL